MPVCNARRTELVFRRSVGGGTRAARSVRAPVPITVTNIRVEIDYVWPADDPCRAIARFQLSDFRTVLAKCMQVDAKMLAWRARP